MGVYKSDAKFKIAIYLVPVLDALIVSIKNVESNKKSAIFHLHDIELWRKIWRKNAEKSISEGEHAGPRTY